LAGYSLFALPINMNILRPVKRNPPLIFDFGLRSPSLEQLPTDGMAIAMGM